MASEEALLQVLVSPPRLDIQALGSSVLRFFQIITKWKAEKQATVDAIVKQYDGTIKISLDMAQIGYNFAEDAMTLSKLVAKREVDEEQLRDFLAEMLRMADTAHGQASTMNEQFSTIRQSIFQIQRDGPQEKLLETPSGILQYPAELTKQVSRGSVPPDISATPLENASNDLISLATCVGTFVDWWGGVRMKLNSLQSSIRLIKLDGSNPLREQVVLERWTGLRDQYVHYQSMVGAITDYLPPIAKRISRVPGDKEGDNPQTASSEVEEHSNNEGNNLQTASPEGEEQHSNNEGDNQQTVSPEGGEQHLNGEGGNPQTAGPEVEEQHSNNEGNNQQTRSPKVEEQHSNNEGDNQQTVGEQHLNGEGDNPQTPRPEGEEQHSNNEGDNPQMASSEGKEQHSNNKGDNQQTAGSKHTKPSTKQTADEQHESKCCGSCTIM